MNINTIAFRHGESFANECRRLFEAGRDSEVPVEYWKLADHEFSLTEKGERQAQEIRPIVAEIIGNKRVLPVTSHFTRARQTAVSVLPNADWQIEPRFAERNFGDVNGYQKRFGHNKVDEQFQRSFREADFIPFINGETFRETVTRVEHGLTYWQQVAAQLQAEILLISAHGEILRALRAIGHQIQPDEYHQKLSGSVHNCQLDHFSINCPESTNQTGLWYRTLRPPYQAQPWNRIR